MEMLSRRAKRGLEKSIKFGCRLRLLPYRWHYSKTKPRLASPTKQDVHIFHFHQSVMTCYTLFMIYRFIQASTREEYFPLQQRLLAALWTNAYTLTSVGFFQIHLRRREIMKYANKFLFDKEMHTPLSEFEEKRPELRRIRKKEQKILSWHVYLALFLLYTNPGVHTLIQSDSPCAPHFISSSILKCRFIAENTHSIAQKVPFALFELYTIFMFLYICSINWTLIMLGLTYATVELRKMRHSTVDVVTGLGKWNSVFHAFRCMTLLINQVNDLFRYYLMVFPSILFLIVSLLMFGTIRLWQVDMQANLMYPLCGMRCGFEATSPLAMAGNVSTESQVVLAKWRGRLQQSLSSGTGSMREKRIERMSLRSCQRIRCTASFLYTFEHSIVLCSINNCIQLTLNLLVTFGKNE